ncbi:hypothetical protein TGCAST_362370 [Toxoplasma gondii CAST]|uniref:Uncharacterized protein n=1 Tax=Toxoplasma gondii CAST TaxID=943122 RepID=A0A3R8ALG3_TOXGO|nr:hypothetical protein TGCAST_362370 [Toxoplasma gondii CAST]
MLRQQLRTSRGTEAKFTKRCAAPGVESPRRGDAGWGGRESRKKRNRREDKQRETWRRRRRLEVQKTEREADEKEHRKAKATKRWGEPKGAQTAEKVRKKERMKVEGRKDMRGNREGKRERNGEQ